MLTTEENIQRLVKDRKDYWSWGFMCGAFWTSVVFYAISVILSFL